MSPEVAIIPVGDWTYGKDTENRFSTYWYGHPRRDVINMLENSLPKDDRSSSIRPKLASKPGKFRVKKIKKRIYATAWDGNIKIKIYEDGHRSVMVNRRP
jgi:hypothetical protein